MPRILILDNDVSVLRAAAIFFEAHGYEVVTSGSAADFEKLLEREMPDLALIDVSMPDTTGDTLVGKIRRRLGYRCCPLLFWSSKPPEQLEELVRSSGASGFISKSWTSTAILEQIQAFSARNE